MRKFVLLMPLMILGFSCSTKTTWYFYENPPGSGVKERGYARGKVRWHVHKVNEYYSRFTSEKRVKRYLCKRKKGLWIYCNASGDTLKKHLYQKDKPCDSYKIYKRVPKQKTKRMPKGFME